jgi:hypothetical protein
MKTKLLVLLMLSCLLFHPVAFAQKGYADKVNQVNEKGQKEGLWKEDFNKYWRTETYYHKGKKNGLYKMFSTVRNELETFGEYRSDTITGTWYYFGDYGHLIMIQKNFQNNTHQIPAEHHAQGFCPYCCYSIAYYPNGNKKSEGILLWDEAPESDFTFEYGEWKYYDENGNLTKTKVFK